ncbi:Glycosyltransferase family 92 [Trinorchestia longiramus]|nr:Glycosyltransferase family 92 [Trinorchestia longiramus]
MPVFDDHLSENILKYSVEENNSDNFNAYRPKSKKEILQRRSRLSESMQPTKEVAKENFSKITQHSRKHYWRSKPTHLSSNSSDFGEPFGVGNSRVASGKSAFKQIEDKQAHLKTGRNGGTKITETQKNSQNVYDKLSWVAEKSTKSENHNGKYAREQPKSNDVAVKTGFVYKNSSQPEYKSCSCWSLNVNWAAFSLQNMLPQLDPVTNHPAKDTLRMRMFNLPLELYMEVGQQCDLLPPLFQIKFVNDQWQQYDHRDGIFYLYTAYYDNRTKTGGVARVLVMTDMSFESHLPWCHLWYPGQLEPVPSKVLRAEITDSSFKVRDGDLRAYLLTCSAPPHVVSSHVPLAVSLVPHPCHRASNVLKEDVSNRLVEWLELLRTLNVSKVFLYIMHVHPNTRKVLQFYERNGFVEHVTFRYPPPYINEPLLIRSFTDVERWKYFFAADAYHTDCVLRHRLRFRFIAVLDIDELPVLNKHATLPEYVQYAHKRASKQFKLPPSIELKWQYFPMDNPLVPKLRHHNGSTSGNVTNSKSYIIDVLDMSETLVERDHKMFHERTDTNSMFTILQNTRRLKHDRRPTHRNFKAIHDMNDVTAVNPHQPQICAAGACGPVYREKLRVAYMGHFRNPCQDRECSNPLLTVEVPTLVKMRSKVIPRVEQVWHQLNIADDRSNS